ncbi:carbonic anhydrase, partial [Daedaleopsis nitida]
VLWIGCADSRVPEAVVTASMPGVIFVHRNIANQFDPTDDNGFSVLSYAVETVGVQHIIVVGHTRCGGVAAAMSTAQDPSPSPPSSALERWLEPLVELARDTEHNLDVLTRANVRAQVEKIARLDVVQRVCEASGRMVRVHGWMYVIEEGRLRDLDMSVVVGKEENVAAQ